MVRSTLLHLSCSGVPKGKISKFQIFCDFWTSDWNLISVIRSKSQRYSWDIRSRVWTFIWMCFQKVYTQKWKVPNRMLHISRGSEFKIFDDFRWSPGFEDIIFTHFGAQQRKANVSNMVRSTLLHLSCSGVPKGKISKFQIFCDFWTLDWNLISVIRFKS